MKIFGLEIKKIDKKKMPEKIVNDYRKDTGNWHLSDKGKDYLFGEKGGPFTTKKNQAYVHYDGLRIVHNRIYFTWKGDNIISMAIIGHNTYDPLEINGIIGKQKVSMN